MGDASSLGSIPLLALLLLWVALRSPKTEDAPKESEGIAAEASAERQRLEAAATAESASREAEARAAKDKQATQMRAERERREAAERARQEAERSKLQAERDSFLRSTRMAAPDFILNARLDFEREYRASGGEAMFGQEMSPLVCFGYRVGKTNGRSETERRAILAYAIVADLDVTLPFLPVAYRREWGGPLSATRFNRVLHHLDNMADLREGRRSFEVAVSHWRADASWFRAQQRPVMEKYRGI